MRNSIGRTDAYLEFTHARSEDCFSRVDFSTKAIVHALPEAAFLVSEENLVRSGSVRARRERMDETRYLF